MKIKSLKKDIGLFLVLEDLGMKYATDKSIKKTRYCIVKCKQCGNQYTGCYQSFKRLHTNCECQKTPKFTKQRKRIYKTHFGMMSRCYDKNNNNYMRYGLRGITVCEEWKESYETFYNWAINSGYTDQLTIDRIDNNKGYSPENCRWTTAKTQVRNRECTINIDKVKEIKKLLHSGYTHNSIAKMVNTSAHRVSNISKGRTWVDIN